MQYVDHNLLQADERNAEDHVFLRSAASRFGLWFSKPGNGVSHPTHMQRFGVPGKTLVGLRLAHLRRRVAGHARDRRRRPGGRDGHRGRAAVPADARDLGCPADRRAADWVSAKDVILEMLRRHGVKGGVNRIIEYHGPGLAGLTAMDRHVIANMGAELGATTTVFPADDAVRDFLRAEGREDDFVELLADPDADYDVDRRDRPVHARAADRHAVARRATWCRCGRSPASRSHQVVIGSSANPGLRDFAIAAAIVAGRQTHAAVSFDVNPTSREILADLTKMGATFDLIAAGARIHQAGCMGCIGMGQAPATGRNSLRTVPAQLPRPLRHRRRTRSGCAPRKPPRPSALTGVITDPRDLADATRHRLPDARPAASGHASTPRCWCRRCRRRRPHRSSW